MEVLSNNLVSIQDELARLRRQSISRIPTLRASGVGVLREEVIDEGSPSNSKDGLNNSLEGSFMNFGRTVQSPTVLNKKVSNLMYNFDLSQEFSDYYQNNIFSIANKRLWYFFHILIT